MEEANAQGNLGWSSLNTCTPGHFMLTETRIISGEVNLLAVHRVSNFVSSPPLCPGKYSPLPYSVV